jgi:hypothetical protein
MTEIRIQITGNKEWRTAGSVEDKEIRSQAILYAG